MLRSSLTAAFVIAPLCGLCAGQAVAQEYCVACTGPTALYRCVIDGAQPGGGQPLQMLCITAMAKAGGHATCSVTRGTVFECDGPVKRVPWTAASGQDRPTAAPAAPAEAIQTPAAAVPKPATEEGEPKTLVELADRANRKTAEDLKKAGESVKEGAKSVGDSVTNATKKTWDCVASLFSKC
jgi:hypothetical protein